jgi:hypothetical protein
MSKSQVIIKRAHVFLGGPYHGAVKMVRADEMAYLLPRRELPRVAYDDVRTHFAKVLYVRETTAGGDVFVYSELGPKARAALIEEYRNDPHLSNHRAR